MNGLGNRHWPDQMFLAPGKRIIFIEFKREGEAPTEGQKLLHEILRDMEFSVDVVDDADYGRQLIDAWLL